MYGLISLEGTVVEMALKFLSQAWFSWYRREILSLARLVNGGVIKMQKCPNKSAERGGRGANYYMGGFEIRKMKVG